MQNASGDRSNWLMELTIRSFRRERPGANFRLLAPDRSAPMVRFKARSVFDPAAGASDIPHHPCTTPAQFRPRASSPWNPALWRVCWAFCRALASMQSRAAPQPAAPRGLEPQLPLIVNTVHPIMLLQLTKYQQLRESRLHGQMRQFHGRMRHRGCPRAFTGGFAYCFGANP